MTINEKNVENLKPQPSGDHQVAGTPITKAEDNAHQQRQEKVTALKAFRFTNGDSAPFTIDMGNGEKVQDKRPMRQEPSAGDVAAAALKEKLDHGKTELGKENLGKSDFDKLPKADIKDAQGHITQKNYADGRHTDIHYDKNGQPDEVKTPDGQTFKKHVAKDGKPDGTWDVTVPKDKSPDGKEHHYNAKIDVKVDGDGAVSWTTKAGEHSKIDQEGKFHKDAVKENADSLHTDLSKRDMGESTKSLCEQVNKDGNAADVYQKLLKEHPEDKDKVHLVTKFDENGKMKMELAPGPDPMESVTKQVRTANEAKDLDTALCTRDLGVSAQAKLDQINKNGDGKGVYDKLSDDDKKMVHLENVDGKEVLKLGPAPDGKADQVTAVVEANELSQDLHRIDMGASARQMVDRINGEGNGEAVYNKLGDADKKMVHLEEHNGVKTLVLGGEAPTEARDGKVEAPAAAARDITDEVPRPDFPNQHFNKKDHLWHNNQGEVVQPPQPETYGAAGMLGLYNLDLQRYNAHKLAPHDRAAEPAKLDDTPNAGARDLTDEVPRPDFPNQHFNKKDHLWHNNEGEVVEPPQPEAYGAAGLLGIYHTDIQNYNAYKLKHHKDGAKELSSFKAPGDEPGEPTQLKDNPNAAARDITDEVPRPDFPNQHYNKKDHLWHNNNGEVVQPPAPESYGAAGMLGLYNLDLQRYNGYKLEHKDDK